MSAEDFVPLTDFSLRWRWTQASHAQFGRDALASVRPIRATKAAAILEGDMLDAVSPTRAEDRLAVNDSLDPQVVGGWFEERIPQAESDLLLLWDQQTAALVPRRLFIDRWDDFWYPRSDDLTVIGSISAWRIEMHHEGVFDFVGGGAVEQAVAADGAAPRR